MSCCFDENFCFMGFPYWGSLRLGFEIGEGEVYPVEVAAVRAESDGVASVDIDGVERVGKYRMLQDFVQLKRRFRGGAIGDAVVVDVAIRNWNRLD